MNRVLWACAALMVFVGPVVRGQLAVGEDDKGITISCSAPLAWKAVVDKGHGGVVSEFHLPADGPNLISTTNSDGSPCPFRGLFDTFYMTRVEGKTDQERVKAKGSFWQNGRGTVRVLSSGPDRVIVETSGKAGGWRRLSPKKEDIVEFRQRYTFRPDGIGVAGEVKWIYGYGTNIEDVQPETFLTPGIVNYPVIFRGGSGAEQAVGITSSGGARFPDGINYPLTMLVALRNGHRLEFHYNKVPAALEKSRWFFLERPWQQEWTQGLGVSADPNPKLGKFPRGEPASYEYEFTFAKISPGQMPPTLTITSPTKEATFLPGAEVKLTASVVGGDGKPMTADGVEWKVYRPFTKPFKDGKGASIGFTIPSREDLGKQDYIWAVATVADANGRKSADYMKFNIELDPKAAGPFEWEAAAPETQEMSSAKLKAMQEALAADHTHGLIVVRNDKVVCEWYAKDFPATKPHYTASAAKALVGGVSTAVAINDGRISLDDLAAKYVPAWRDDPKKSKITIRQLGSHTSGLEDAEDEKETPHNKLAGWKGEFWKAGPVPNDPFTLSRDKTQVVFEPGTKESYSNPGIAMLAYCLTGALREAPQKDMRTLLRDRVMRPIGIKDEEWSVGYRKTYNVDGLPLVAAWGGAAFTPRAAARVARLMMRDGSWDGKQLISFDAVRQVTRDAGTAGNGGIGWWTNNDGMYAKLPRDAFWGAGAGHQVVLVVRSLNMIAVRNGDTLTRTGDWDKAVEEELFNPLMDAIQKGGPKPEGQK